FLTFPGLPNGFITYHNPFHMENNVIADWDTGLYFRVDPITATIIVQGQTFVNGAPVGGPFTVYTPDGSVTVVPPDGPPIKINELEDGIVRFAEDQTTTIDLSHVSLVIAADGSGALSDEHGSAIDIAPGQLTTLTEANDQSLIITLISDVGQPQRSIAL